MSELEALDEDLAHLLSLSPTPQRPKGPVDVLGILPPVSSNVEGVRGGLAAKGEGEIFAQQLAQQRETWGATAQSGKNSRPPSKSSKCDGSTGSSSNGQSGSSSSLLERSREVRRMVIENRERAFAEWESQEAKIDTILARLPQQILGSAPRHGSDDVTASIVSLSSGPRKGQEERYHDHALSFHLGKQANRKERNRIRGSGATAFSALDLVENDAETYGRTSDSFIGQESFMGGGLAGRSSLSDAHESILSASAAKNKEREVALGSFFAQLDAASVEEQDLAKSAAEGDEESQKALDHLRGQTTSQLLSLIDEYKPKPRRRLLKGERILQRRMRLPNPEEWTPTAAELGIRDTDISETPRYDADEEMMLASGERLEAEETGWRSTVMMELSKEGNHNRRLIDSPSKRDQMGGRASFPPYLGDHHQYLTNQLPGESWRAAKLSDLVARHTSEYDLNIKPDSLDTSSLLVHPEQCYRVSNLAPVSSSSGSSSIVTRKKKASLRNKKTKGGSQKSRSVVRGAA